MEWVNNLVARNDCLLIFDICLRHRLDNVLANQITFASEEKAAVCESESAGNQVKPVRLERPAHDMNSSRPNPEMFKISELREKDVLKRITCPRFHENFVWVEVGASGLGVFQHALRF